MNLSLPVILICAAGLLWFGIMGAANEDGTLRDRARGFLYGAMAPVIFLGIALIGVLCRGSDPIRG